MIDFDIDLKFFSVGTERYEFINLFQGYYSYNGNGNGSGGNFFHNEELAFVYSKPIKWYVEGFGLCD